MIRIELGESTLDRSRIAMSPLNELVAGLELMHRERERPRAPWPYTDWVERAREVLRSVPETAPLQVYAQLYGAEHARRTPDLFTPVPLSARPVLAEQVQLVRKTSHAVVEEHQRLLLVPLILAQERLACSTDHAEILMVTYQARGAAVLAQKPVRSRPSQNRLAQLIGPGRAAVLRALGEPSTTTGLAARLGLSPSTVSEQLGSLLEIGVVHRSRTGRQVLYGLEPAGTALLALFAEDSDPAEALEHPGDDF